MGKNPGVTSSLELNIFRSLTVKPVPLGCLAHSSAEIQIIEAPGPEF